MTLFCQTLTTKYFFTWKSWERLISLSLTANSCKLKRDQLESYAFQTDSDRGQKRHRIVTYEQFWRQKLLLWHFSRKFGNNHYVDDDCSFFSKNRQVTSNISGFFSLLNNLRIDCRISERRQSHYHGWVNREESRPRQTKKRWKL